MTTYMGVSRFQAGYAWQSLWQAQAVQLACAAAISAENDPSGFAYVSAFIGQGTALYDMRCEGEVDLARIENFGCKDEHAAGV